MWILWICARDFLEFFLITLGGWCVWGRKSPQTPCMRFSWHLHMYRAISVAGLLHRASCILGWVCILGCSCAAPRRPGQSVPGDLRAPSTTAAATDSYLVQLHLIRCPPASSQAAGALIRGHDHDVVPPGKEGQHKHWTLRHLSSRSPSNTCHTPPREDLLHSLPSKQWKGSVRKRPAFQLHQRREHSC